MILISDLHIKKETASVVFGEVFPGVISEMKNRGETHLAILGDLYHLRYKVDVELQNQLYETLRSITERKIFVDIIPGNHDQIDTDGRNALEVFNEIEGVSVHVNPAVEDRLAWIPYRSNAVVRDFVAREVAGSNVLAVFMHHGVQGALMNDFIANTDGLSADTFASAPIVFCGHYHKPQVIGNVHYVGSPYQTKADEAGQPKGYTVWNGGAPEFVAMHWGPKYHSITLENDQLDLSGIAERDIVRVRTSLGVSDSKVRKYLAGHGVGNYTVVPDVEPLQERLSVAPEAGLESFGDAYVDAVQTVHNKDLLKSVFREAMAAVRL